jgi:hypothetical protein
MKDVERRRFVLAYLKMFISMCKLHVTWVRVQQASTLHVAMQMNKKLPPFAGLTLFRLLSCNTSPSRSFAEVYQLFWNLMNLLDSHFICRFRCTDYGKDR